MSKKFFYVCAGIFLLALSFHLGAASALGQSGRRLLRGGATYACGVDDSGTIWAVQQNGLCPSGPIQPPKPGTIVDVAIYATNGCDFEGVVLYEDGDVYRYDSGTWTLTANVFAGGPTAAHSSTWGQVKDRYRK